MNDEWGRGLSPTPDTIRLSPRPHPTTVSTSPDPHPAKNTTKERFDVNGSYSPPATNGGTPGPRHAAPDPAPRRSWRTFTGASRRRRAAHGLLADGYGRGGVWSYLQDQYQAADSNPRRAELLLALAAQHDVEVVLIADAARDRAGVYDECANHAAAAAVLRMVAHTLLGSPPASTVVGEVDLSVPLGTLRDAGADDGALAVALRAVAEAAAPAVGGQDVAIVDSLAYQHDTRARTGR